MEEAAIGIGMSQAALAAYCTQSVAGFDGLQEVSKFGRGQSNPTYLITAASGRYVLRSKPSGALLPSAHAVEREFRVMSALANTTIPVPKMLCLADGATSPSGRAFFVMRYVPGRIFWDPALPGLSVAERMAIYDQMNATLAALHQLDPKTLGLSDFGKPGQYFARQLNRWSKQYNASVATADPRMSQIMDWLALALPEDDGQVALVHGDWRQDNMIFASEDAEIKSVLDWELSTLGHPMADLAYQCMQWRLPHDGSMRGLGGVDRAALGIPDESAYLTAYARRRGLQDVPDWPFYLVFAFFRLAAILAGVAARARQGNASNPEMARKYGEAVPLLADMALGVIRDGP